MDIKYLSTPDYELLIAEQVRRLRILADLNQSELASAANVSIGALKNLETGKGSSLKTLIMVLRAFGREDWLQSLAPDNGGLSPLQKLRAEKAKVPRRRVYKTGLRRHV
jgi:transcriptional regulator with XRE-family HTH domain